MDALDMKELPNGNTVLDKGKSLYILCGVNSLANVSKMLAEIFRILVPLGYYMVIIYGMGSRSKKKYPETQPWTSLNVDKLTNQEDAVSSTINSDENS